MNRLTALAAVLLLPGLALAQGSDADFQLRLGSGPDFEQQRREIVDEMHGGGRYGEIGSEARAEVILALETIGELADDQGRFEHLSEEDKIRLYNAQEVANNHLTLAAEYSRVECRRERKVGSHFKTSICHTVAEWDLQRRSASEALNQKQRGPICSSGGACGPPAQGPPRF